jgi:hypothetical protein
VLVAVHGVLEGLPRSGRHSQQSLRDANPYQT